MKVDKPRETALKILYEVNEKEAYVNIALSKHLDSHGLKDIDRAFITDLVYGTVSHKLTIDYLIEKYSDIPMRKLSRWILNILRLGIYQLMYMDRVPVSAACNESVNLAKKYGHKASSGFVNAVLRKIAATGAQAEYPDRSADPARHLSVRYSHPEWLVRNWIERFGEEFTERLLEANNAKPEFTIRANRLKTDRETLAGILREKGYITENGRYNIEALIVKNPGSITASAEFRDGLFQVQDESSMLVSRILDPKPGSLVLDVCSAPGGKATHIAELMENKGTVIARDIHPHKIRLVEEAAGRLGTGIIKTEIFDAAITDENLRDKADYVLVDAPCTGFGIIRRKPDIKWSRSEKDTEEIRMLQMKILRAASACVKPGGILVYSTCTVQKEENEDVMAEFLGENDNFAADDIFGLLPEGLLKETAARGFVQLYPHVDGVDGFFIARLRRIK